MDTAMKIRLVIEAILSYHALLAERGVDYSIPSLEDLSKMDLSDLQTIERRIRDIARTPGQG